ncbi:MAG: hypothetical protein HZB91_07570 [Elusimicrobia bacterium]|nr:hypothetical protein [Elusimicrobiota bacterium]
MGLFIKTLVLTVLFLACLAAGGSIALRMFLPPEKLREVVIAQLEKRLDREVRLSGVSLGLVQGLVVDRLEISEEEGFSEGIFAAAGTARLRIQWLPLARRRIVAESVSLDDARFNLIRRLDGTLNLPGSGRPKKRKPPRKEGETRLELDVRYVEVSRGRFTYDNLIKKTGWDIGAISIGASNVAASGEFPVEVSMHARRRFVESVLEGDVTASGTLDLGGFDPDRMSASVTEFRTSLWGLDAAASGTIRRFRLPEFRIDAKVMELGAVVARGKLDIDVVPGARVEAGRRKKALDMRLDAGVPTAGTDLLARRVGLPKGVPRLPETRVAGTFRLEAGDLQVLGFEASSRVGSLSASGRVRQLGRKAKPFLTLASEIEVPAFDTEDIGFLRKVPQGLSVPASRVRARLRLAPKEVEIDSLAVDIGPSTVELAGHLDRDSGGRTRLTLKAGRIALDAGLAGGIMPKTRKLGLSGRVDGSLSVDGELHALSVKGDFRLQDLAGEFKGIQVSRLSGGGTLSGRDLSVPRLEGEAAGGKVVLKDLTLIGLGRKLKVTVNGEFDRLDLEKFLASRNGAVPAQAQSAATTQPPSPRPRKPPVPLALQGTFRVGGIDHPLFSARDLKLEWDLQDVTKDLSEMNGASTVTVASGRFRSLDALCSRSTVAKVLLMPLLAIQKVQRLPGLNTLPDLTDVAFTRIRGAYVFRDGVMEIRECALSSLTLDIAVGGTADFHGDRLDLDVAIRLLKLPMPMKFSVTGDLREPKVRFNPVSSVLSPIIDPARKIFEFFSPR